MSGLSSPLRPASSYRSLISTPTAFSSARWLRGYAINCITLSKLELREEEVARLRDRNAHLESELKLQERHLANALKNKKLALKPARRR